MSSSLEMHVTLIPLKPVCISRIFELAYVNLVLGQGMNASMNDSHNLGARLSYISLKKKLFLTLFQPGS